MDIVTIKISLLEGSKMSTDLGLRHTLVDTLEARDICKVIEEGTGEGYMLVVVSCDASKNVKKIKSILQSLTIFDESEIIVE